MSFRSVPLKALRSFSPGRAIEIDFINCDDVSEKAQKRILGRGMQNELLQLSDQDAARITDHIASLDYLALNTAKGPYDLMLISEARRRLPSGVFVHAATPLAIFPLGTQEVDRNLCCTYVGGRDIHQGIGYWPKGGDGEILPFIAQIDLRGVSGYDGKHSAIQVFGLGRDEFAYRWVGSLATCEQGPTISQFRLYGSPPVSIPSYPGSWAIYEAEEDIQLSCEERFGGQQLLDLPMFLTPLGVCIGPTPYVPAHAAGDGTFDGLTILACVPTLYPQVGRPFELVGHPAPLSEAEAQRLRVVIGPSFDDDSFGILYICQSIENGDIQLRFVPL